MRLMCLETQARRSTGGSSRSPRRVFSHHLEDQIADFFRNFRPASSHPRSADQSPIESESRAMPAHDRIRREQEEPVFPVGPESSGNDPEHSIESTDSWSRMFAFKDSELLTEGKILQQQTLTRTKDAKKCSEPEEDVEHDGTVIAARILVCAPMSLMSKPGIIVARDSSLIPTKGTGLGNTTGNGFCRACRPWIGISTLLNEGWGIMTETAHSGNSRGLRLFAKRDTITVSFRKPN